MSTQRLFPGLTIPELNAIRSEYPFPIAVMFSKVLKIRNDEVNASDLSRQLLLLFEVLLKVFATVAAARYRLDTILVGMRDKAVEAEFRKFKGAVGDGIWKEILRTVLDAYNRKELEKTKLPGLTDMKQVLLDKWFDQEHELFRDHTDINEFVTAHPGFDQEETYTQLSPNRINYITVLNDLKNFRNTISHTAGLHQREYMRQNRVLLSLLGSLLRDASFLKNHRLGYVKEIHAVTASKYEAHVTVSKGGELDYDPNFSYVTSHFIERGHVYLWEERNEAYYPILNLHPFVIFEYCTVDHQDRYFFFNGAPDKHTAYLSYCCGHNVTFPKFESDLEMYRDRKKWEEEAWIHETPVVGGKQVHFERIATEYLNSLTHHDDLALKQAKEKLVITAGALQLDENIAQKLVDKLLETRVNALRAIQKRMDAAVDFGRDIGPAREDCSETESFRPPPETDAPETDASAEHGSPLTPDFTPVAAIANSHAEDSAESSYSDEPEDKQKTMTASRCTSESDPQTLPVSSTIGKESSPSVPNSVTREDFPFDLEVHFPSSPKKVLGVSGLDDLVVLLDNNSITRVLDGKLRDYPPLSSPVRVLGTYGPEQVLAGGWDGVVSAVGFDNVKWQRHLAGTISAICPSSVGGWWAVGTWAGDLGVLGGDGTVLWVKRTEEGVYRLFVAPDSARILRADLEGTISMYDAGGNILWGGSLDARTEMVSWAPSGDVAIVTKEAIHLFSGIGQRLGSLETEQQVLACFPAQTPRCHQVITTDGAFNDVGPVTQGTRTELRVRQSITSIGPAEICTVGPTGTLAVVCIAEDKRILRLIRREQVLREYTLPWHTRSLFWRGLSGRIWLLTDDNWLAGYREIDMIKNLTPAAFSITAASKEMRRGIYQMLEIQLCNTGQRQAKNVTLDLAGDIKTTGLPVCLGDIAGGCRENYHISINPTAEGEVPLTVIALYKDEITGVVEQRVMVHIQVRGGELTHPEAR